MDVGWLQRQGINDQLGPMNCTALLWRGDDPHHDLLLPGMWRPGPACREN